jgi:membrane-associated protease RseP (regulator of RpoE activity)
MGPTTVTTEGAERGPATPPTGAGDPAVAGSGEPVVVRPDHPLRRWWRSLHDPVGPRRPRSELHRLRLVLTVAAMAALGFVAPGALVFVAILAAIVVIHEGGHFLVARRCGMRPTEFFVGFGPTVIARTSPSGVRWGLKALPLGGYVKLPGMGPSEEVEASDEPYTYRAATRPRRLAVILAGVAANLLLAVALFFAFAMTSPDVDAGVGRSLTGSVSLANEVATGTASGLGRLVTGADDYAGSVVRGEVPDNRMVSAVGGAQITAGLLDQHPSRLLLLAGLFSIAVAVLNLLPLLPLDGGHAALVLAEGAIARVRRRPRYRLDPRTFRPVAVVVLVALLALGASSMYLDVVHPITVTTG